MPSDQRRHAARFGPSRALAAESGPRGPPVRRSRNWPRYARPRPGGGAQNGSERRPSFFPLPERRNGAGTRRREGPNSSRTFRFRTTRDVLGHRGPGRDAAGTAAPGRRVPPEDCPDVGPLPWRGGIPLAFLLPARAIHLDISARASRVFARTPAPGGDAVSGSRPCAHRRVGRRRTKAGKGRRGQDEKDEGRRGRGKTRRAPGAKGTSTRRGRTPRPRASPADFVDGNQGVSGRCADRGPDGLSQS